MTGFFSRLLSRAEPHRPQETKVSRVAPLIAIAGTGKAVWSDRDTTALTGIGYGRNAVAYVVDPQGLVLATSGKGPDIDKDLAALPQVASALTGTGQTTGKDWRGQDVLTASAAVPKFKWTAFFEQPTAQALTPIRDQLVRVALLIGLGLFVAILAGMVLARRMLIPITALSSGARLLGEGKFGHRIEVKTKDELEELAG